VTLKAKVVGLTGWIIWGEQHKLIHTTTGVIKGVMTMGAASFWMRSSCAINSRRRVTMGRVCWSKRPATSTYKKGSRDDRNKHGSWFHDPLLTNYGLRDFLRHAHLHLTCGLILNEIFKVRYLAVRQFAKFHTASLYRRSDIDLVGFQL
jgi:hypothetical protein